MEGNFTVKVVLARMAYQKGLIDRVRTLLLGSETSLIEIFARACEHLPLLERIADMDEHAHFLRIDNDGALIALAALMFDETIEGPAPYRVEWCRTPSDADVELWQRQIQDLLERSSQGMLETDDALKVDSDCKIKLIYNHMHTRSFALPLDKVYLELYKVESRMMLNYARGHHLLEDIGG